MLSHLRLSCLSPRERHRQRWPPGDVPALVAAPLLQVRVALDQIADELVGRLLQAVAARTREPDFDAVCENVLPLDLSESAGGSVPDGIAVAEPPPVVRNTQAQGVALGVALVAPGRILDAVSNLAAFRIA